MIVTPEELSLMHEIKEETGLGLLKCKEYLYLNHWNKEKTLLWIKENQWKFGKLVD